MQPGSNGVESPLRFGPTVRCFTRSIRAAESRQERTLQENRGVRGGVCASDCPRFPPLPFGLANGAAEAGGGQRQPRRPKHHETEGGYETFVDDRADRSLFRRRDREVCYI